MKDKCPKCGSSLVKHAKKEIINYKGKSHIIESITLKCGNCKNEIDPNADERLKEKIRFERTVDGYLTDEDIRRIRKKLGLSQEEMAIRLGVGLKNFARYENLAVRQSKAMDNLLRVLDVYPDAIRLLGERVQNLQ